jgi:hypothetical protein
VFADVSDSSLLLEQELSYDAPRWRSCAQGLNVEGRCENHKCAAFGQMVIHTKGFRLFNLRKMTMSSVLSVRLRCSPLPVAFTTVCGSSRA